jgi:NAD(P)-dependent dehydrogenase (short-subunit alcohol dehydrogenase family)
MTMLKDKVAVVTGAGQGIGREEALALAAVGATVVVNDVGRSAEGESYADAVVAEIRAAGGTAVAHYEDISEWAGGESLIALALEAGSLDIVVCNAGIVRDRMLYNMTADEWDAVVRVHLRGHFIPTRLAATHWRGLTKSTGQPVDGRIIYTTSEAGLFGHIGQCNYAAAKAGITGLCFTAAQELERFGVTVNTVSPRGRTPMTEDTFGDFVLPEGFDEWDPSNVAPFVVFLAGPHAAKMSGQVFVVYGGTVTRLAGWQELSQIENDHRWTQAELLERAPELAEGLEAPPPVFSVVTPGSVAHGQGAPR